MGKGEHGEEEGKGREYPVSLLTVQVLEGSRGLVRVQQESPFHHVAT